MIRYIFCETGLGGLLPGYTGPGRLRPQKITLLQLIHTLTYVREAEVFSFGALLSQLHKCAVPSPNFPVC